MTAKRLLDRFGSPGVLYIPTQNGVYDPQTGENTITFTQEDVLFVTVPLDDTYGEGLQQGANGVIWFAPFNNIGGTAYTLKNANGCYISSTIEGQTIKYDILEVNFVIERDKVRAIEAQVNIK